LNLYKEGKTLQEVAELVGKHKSVVWRICKKSGIVRTVSEFRKGLKLSRKHRENISKGLNNSEKTIGHPVKDIVTDYKQITPELVYIIGVLMGDGYFTKYGIGLETIDKEFTDEFERCIKVQFGLKSSTYYNEKEPLVDWRNGKTYKRKPTYMLRCGSKVVKDFLQELFNYLFVETLDKQLKIHFLRGLWDSEGCYSKVANQVLFYTKNENTIKIYSNIIKNVLNLKGRYYKQKYNNVYKYYFGRKLQVQKFFNVVKPTIQRKVLIQ
ncbi:hypothetical protein LCGC14_3100300, partial [marine sediment metagenome]